MLLRLLPLAPALVVAAALPAPAAAAVQHDYTAYIDVTTTYKNVQSEQTPTKSRNALTSLSTHFVVEAGLTFHNNQLLYPQGRVPVAETTTGSVESIYKDDWRHGTSACTALTRSNPSGHAAIEQDILAPLDGSERLNVRITDALDVEWDCSQTSQFASYADGGFLVDGEIGQGVMDTTFQLPKEAIGQGKIIQLISGPPAGAECPGMDETTTLCSFTWEGQMTLTKVATRTVPDWPGTGGTAPTDDGDDLIAPLVPPPAPPAPSSDDDLIAPLVRPAKASVKGATVSFRAGCASGCSGTAVLTAGGASARAAARKPLATLRFRVAAGPARTVRLKLPRKARAALRRARRGTLAVTLRPTTGAAVRTTLALTVRR